jgi:hypothetical protein
MKKSNSISQLLDNFGRRHPRLMWFANALLMLLVTLTLLTTTEAPVVLYQAF